jgi:non-ribosomal peptide synthetase component E (peptide arylation enzyme)
MTDFSHLNAIQERIQRENSRLAAAVTENERAFRAREIKAAEKELAAEYKFLGIEPVSLDEILLSDDELLAELKG